MVRLTLKRSLREESCCNLLVVNGGAALRRRSFFSTLRTSQSAVSSAVRILVASSFSSLISSCRQVLRRDARQWLRLRGPGQARDRWCPYQALVSSAWQQPSLCRG